MGKGLCCGDAEERERERETSLDRPFVCGGTGGGPGESLTFFPPPPFSSSMFAKKWMGSGWKGKGERGKRKSYFSSLPSFSFQDPSAPGRRKVPFPPPFFFSTSFSLPLRSPPLSHGQFRKRERVRYLPRVASYLLPPLPLAFSRWEMASEKAESPGAEPERLLSLSTQRDGMRKETRGLQRKRKKNLQRTFSSEKTTMLEAKHVW